MWKVAAGSILARALAASKGRCWCDGPQALPSSRTKTRSRPVRPAVSSAKSARPSSVSTTWRGFPAFELANGDRPGLGVEIGGAHPGQLAIAATGEQSAFDDVAESAIAGVHDPPAFVVGQEVDNGRVGLAERLHLAPCLVSRDAAIMEGVIERGLENREGPVCRRAARPHGVGVLHVDGVALAALSRSRAVRVSLGAVARPVCQSRMRFVVSFASSTSPSSGRMRARAAARSFAKPFEPRRSRSAK